MERLEEVRWRVRLLKVLLGGSCIGSGLGFLHKVVLGGLIPVFPNAVDCALVIVGGIYLLIEGLAITYGGA